MKNNCRIFFLLVLITGFFTGCTDKKTEVETTNPFFAAYNTPFDVPPFEKIMAKHYMPAFEKGMAEGREELKKILESKDTPTFDNTVVPFSNMGDLLTRVSYVFFGLSSANTSDSLQKIEMEISPKLSGYRDEIMLNPDLFKRIKSVYDNQSGMNLNDEQKYLLENLYKGFVRNGALLSPDKQDTLRKLNQKISVLGVDFSQNVLAETNKFRLVIDNKDNLEGLPDGVIQGAAAMGKSTGNEGKWVFTTQKPSMLPFLTYSENRKMRKSLYDAYLLRGNHNDSLDNKDNLKQLVQLRAKRAKLLGYKTHADLNLENRMAKIPSNVFDLCNQLWTPALRVAGEELKAMQKIADREKAGIKIEPSDWWYYAEKLRKEKYDLDDNELRPYFKLDNVREGAFDVANKLYGITFTPIENIPLPHPDAKAFEVKEADGKHLAILYMDFFTRESKRQGAWCGGYRDHRWLDGKEIAPVVTVVCNFNNPTSDTPSLLSLDDVTTLFHEFGHALQGMFSANTYNMAYTAQDIVELPSQIMEHWAVEPEVLKTYAKQYQTGEAITDALVKKITNSKYFNTGFDNVELLAATMLDMAYYTQEDPVNIDVAQFEKDYLNKIGLIKEIEPRYRSTYFLHIIDGYDAGYYVYTWAAVLDNDAFEAFREKGIFDRATADSFRKNVLAPMGIVDAKQSYINFRGRDAVIEPLLKNRGLN
ncbi:MAG TPA: M3 family metallopeptidase [Bacteroidales bacterium]|jgi:peptidyl-dipeptidase Dcp|nr:M3 family metallopeptidase [Bacteroidales bacterium]